VLWLNFRRFLRLLFGGATWWQAWRISMAHDIVELAAALLLVCREQAQVYLRSRDNPRLRQAEGRLIRDAEALFRAVRDEVLSAGELDCVVALLLASRRLPLVVRARAIACGLDLAMQSRLGHRFRDCGVLTLKPDDPVPVMRPPLRDLLGGRVNSRPENLMVAVDRLNHLRLAPRDLGAFMVQLDGSSPWQFAPLIDPGNCLFATGVLNHSMAEFTWVKNERQSTRKGTEPGQRTSGKTLGGYAFTWQVAGAWCS
jgi:hypothetical protein